MLELTDRLRPELSESDFAILGSGRSGERKLRVEDIVGLVI
jgi:hypothetical protein